MIRLRFSPSWFINLVNKYKWCLVGTLLAVLVSVVVIYTIENISYNLLKIFPWKTSNSTMLGKEVSLKLGQSLSIKSENLEIKFLGIVSDSRCPEGANCIWFGQAIVVLNLLKSGKNLGDFQLIDTNDGKVLPTSVDVYKISLLKVEPYPEVNKNINSDDYRITIRVDKV